MDVRRRKRAMAAAVVESLRSEEAVLVEGVRARRRGCPMPVLPAGHIHPDGTGAEGCKAAEPAKCRWNGVCLTWCVQHAGAYVEEGGLGPCQRSDCLLYHPSKAQVQDYLATVDRTDALLGEIQSAVAGVLDVVAFLKSCPRADVIARARATGAVLDAYNSLIQQVPEGDRPFPLAPTPCRWHLTSPPYSCAPDAPCRPLHETLAQTFLPTCRELTWHHDPHCSYPHVHPHPSAPVCHDFAQGYCQDGFLCTKLHTYAFWHT